MRPSRLAVLALSLLTILATTVVAQGAPQPEGARLTLGSDTLIAFLVRGSDTTQIGRVVDELSERSMNGRRVLHRIYRSDNQLSGPSLDTLIDEFEALRPISQRSRSGRAIELVEFTDRRASGVVLQPTGDSLLVDVGLPQTVFSSSSFDLVLRAAPLADGWTTTVPSFVTSTRVVVPMHARVAGTERIGADECWRVEAEYMGMSVAFWVAQQSRKLCRQEMRVQAGITLLYRRPSEVRALLGTT